MLTIEIPLYKLSTRGAHVPAKGGIIHHLRYRFCKSLRIFRRDGDAGARLLQKLLALAANAEDDRPARTHRLEHLRRNDVAKDRHVLEEYESHVAQPPILLYLRLIHRTGEYDVIETTPFSFLFESCALGAGSDQ